MAWQDLILTVGNIFFILAMIPSIKGKDKPSFYTSLPNSLILISFAIALGSLQLWISAILTLIVSFCWMILAYQKYKIDKKTNSK